MLSCSRNLTKTPHPLQGNPARAEMLTYIIITVLSLKAGRINKRLFDRVDKQ